MQFECACKQNFYCAGFHAFGKVFYILQIYLKMIKALSYFEPRNYQKN